MPWAHEMLISLNIYSKGISDKYKKAILYVDVQQNGVCHVNTTWESLNIN